MTDLEIPPTTHALAEPDKVLPDSFADWLAQPSQTITASSESEPGMCIGLLGESQTGEPTNGDSPAAP